MTKNNHFLDMYIYKKKLIKYPFNIKDNIFEKYIDFNINLSRYYIDFEKYNIPKKSEKKILNYLDELFDWIDINLIHDGNTIYRDKLYASLILEFIKTNNKGINCLMHAIILQEIFHQQGLKAHLVQANPSDYKIGDCHWLVNLYSVEFSKWILIDPVWLGYCKDKNGNPLDVFEIRKSINNNLKLNINKKNKSNYYEYLLCRYLFFFGIFSLNGFGTFEIKNQQKIYISPENFDTKLYIYEKEKNRFQPFNIREYLYFSRFEEKSLHIISKNYRK
ncbi:hypothetical protein [Streptobacillus moniliformis]|uniref:hypothetical protein n=1 Tax=Streptobacillus moniliformis TaxID=34105 RepID=UPI0007E31819|nr:hypothetical protein [Streptobacillus moniliformis]